MRYKLWLPLALTLIWSVSTFGQAQESETSATADRMLAMTHMGKAFKQLSLELRKGDKASPMAIEQGLDVLSGNADLVDALFEKNEIPSMSEASPLIWQQREEFSLASKKLVDAISLLVDAVETGDKKNSKTAVRAVNAACSNCHQTFRIKSN